jgi:dihydrofolate reductase
MARLLYNTITSLDGYVADEDGNFDWCMPDEEVHQRINDLERPNGTLLLGRRLYEILVWWETLPLDDETPDVYRDYAELWRAADKVVYSSTLTEVTSARTTLERSFDLEQVRELLAAADKDVSIGGPTLAAQALAAGLVDELHQFISPVIIGGGRRFLPDGVRLDLELVDTEQFDSGFVHLHYRRPVES